jgi:hypothetical protein
MDYRSPATDDHLRTEELQWARVLSGGDSRRGMALVAIQKFCTAVHEFEPAFRAGVLGAGALEHVRSRLLARLDHALDVLRCNGLGEIDGVGELQAIRTEVVGAKSLAALVGLAERIHAANHVLCEALEVT